MFIAHKSNTLQSYSDSERECRMVAKGMNSTEYNSWIETVTDEEGVVDYSDETGYTIVEFTDENVKERMRQLTEYITLSAPGVSLSYNIKWQDDIGDAEELKDPFGKSQDPKKYVQSHFVPDDSARDARILATEWKRIRAERDRLLTNSDWTQGSDSPLASAKKTEWATYRTKLRTLPEDQKAKTTYASITWPSEPS
tara:strand:- start:3615 stop:4205 length:591 start_codon:yes stop_codon:yes gene_type:complete